MCVCVVCVCSDSLGSSDDGLSSTENDECVAGVCIGVDKCLNVQCEDTECSDSFCVEGVCFDDPTALNGQPWYGDLSRWDRAKR